MVMSISSRGITFFMGCSFEFLEDSFSTFLDGFQVRQQSGFADKVKKQLFVIAKDRHAESYITVKYQQSNGVGDFMATHILGYLYPRYIGTGEVEAV